ncbi:MAG: hypothetical protein AB7O96_05485 [Pseudobdellovibrionaceae bacterium]
MRSIVFSALLFFWTSSGFSRIDDSVDIFFPKQLKFLQYSQTQFSAFWWNFAIVEPLDSMPDFAKASQVCEILQKHQGKELKNLACGSEVGGFFPALAEWARDFPLRERARDLRDELEAAVGEFAFISSDQRSLFDLKRQDPLDQWQVYLQKSQIFSGDLEKQDGFLVDPSSKRIIIPMQFGVTPKMKNVESLIDELKVLSGVALVGSHSASYSNEKQVHADMEIVSIVGLLVLVVFIAFLVLKGRVAALLLFPPVAIAMVLATGVTQLIFGSIHGLTLAFGSGIIGLAVDYGLHGAFNSKSKQTWVSNSIGFFTTLVGLGILVFSGIPLIRQMMVYAALGLGLGFLFFFFLCKYFSKYFSIQSLELNFPEFKYCSVLIFVLISLGITSAFQVDLSFDLRRFNYQEKAEEEASHWFFTRGEKKENYILLHDAKDFETRAQGEAQWASKRGIQYFGVGNYLPSSEVQKENLLSWRNECPKLQGSLTKEAKSLFSPFLQYLCDKREPLQFTNLTKTEYLNQFVSEENFVSLFQAKNADEEKSIRAEFPKAHAVAHSIHEFSNSLEKDLKWMIPVAFLLCSLILFFYYRRPLYVFSAYIPFLTGLGLFFLGTFLLGRSLDLISVLGLLMVFGFSLDYGIFATDVYAFAQPQGEGREVYSALGLAALSNVIGFFPLVFAKHPILHQLGFALFLGTIGTYLGTVWGVKVWSQKLRK